MLQKLVIYLTIGWAISLSAQVLPVGTVDGTVKDPSGALLTGIKVTLQNIDTGVTSDAITNDSGYFFFASSGKFVGDGERQRAISVRNRRSFRQVESKDLC
jgi:hypothetical protein